MLSVWFHSHSLCLTSGTVKVRSGLQSNLGPGDCSAEEAALGAGMVPAPGGCPARRPCLPVKELDAPRAPALTSDQPRYKQTQYLQLPRSFLVFCCVFFVKLTRPSPKKLRELCFITAQCGWLLWVTERGHLGVHGLGSG